MTHAGLTLALTPHGRVVLAASDEAPELDQALAQRLLDAFQRGSGPGLLQLGGAEVGQPLPPVFSYWRELGVRYVTALCTRPGTDTQHTPIPPPGTVDLQTLALGAPSMPGAEYVNARVLEALWHEIDAAFAARRAQTGSTTDELLKQLNPAWNVVGRVYFNLAENRKDELAPFAFLATYTHQLSTHGKAQHLPLGDALHESAGARNRERMLSLLLPVQRAATECAWLREMVDAGEIFHPLRWSATDAFRFLSDVPKLERAGVIVRMPAAWRASRPLRPQVTTTVGSRAAAGLGTDALLDFSMNVTLDGAALTPAEVGQLLSGTRGLAFIRGQWVELDAEQLRRTIDRFKEVEQLASGRGLTFAEATRLLSGAEFASDAGDGAAALDPAWSHVNAGAWLAPLLQSLRSPGELARVEPGSELRGTLRPYQEIGVRWLNLLSQLGLGACLADDMGLGKTIQVLALLLVIRRAKEHGRLPNLLVAPASLIANWQSEIERFAPSLRVIAAHQSTMSAAGLGAIDARQLADADLVITTYGSLLRFSWLAETKWNLIILDEAQAIKNPGAKQTRAAKRLSARARVALTGTPVENRLSDLWSIFDFINPGLLGSAKQFSRYSKRLAATPHNPYGSLRDLVRPYILRRLKSDRSVISDLPEKTEVKAWCQLTRKQAALYQDSVRELREQIAATDGVRRRGLILTFLMRFKQICNHPSQWLKDDAWHAADSGKLARLGELAEVIAAKQEKVLVFTQFREVTDPLAAFLRSAFGRPGLTLHGGTPVKKRKELVQRFQEDELVPFFVISLKVGGSGLNLTAASHVIHFDRWWNPAVESQATDRAFRIGQTKNVLVHKFVCRGTIEEKIDQLIESKTQLSHELLEGGAELNLTELNDDELMRLVSLDIGAAMKE
jgi:non-specific serine/threonine protein kinase